MKRALSGVPKGAWKNVVNLWKRILSWGLYVLTYLAFYVFLLSSLQMIHELVHAVGCSGHRLSSISRAMGDYTPVPFLLTTSLIIYCLLDDWLAGKWKAKQLQRFWTGSSRIFLYGATAVLFLLGVFWANDGPYLSGLFTTSFVEGPHASVSLVFSISLLASMASGLIVGYVPRLPKAVAMLPQLAGAVVLLIIARRIEAQLGPIFSPSIILLWPTLGRACVAFCVLFAAGVLVALAEKRVLGGWTQTASLVSAALLMLCAVMGLGMLLPFRHLLLKVGPDPAHDTAKILIPVVLCVAIAVRLVVQGFKRRGVS